MAPILIDNRGLIKLGLASAVITIAVFAAGFLSGYQQASTFYLAGSESETLALPAQQSLDERALEAKMPEVIVAGEEIDVDQPEQAPVKAAVVKPAAKLVMLTADSMSNDDSRSVIEPVAEKPAATKLPAQQDGDATESAENEPSLIDVTSLSSVELEKIKYSIQVGMYGRLINAENMMKMLQAQNFNAYVSDYSNKENETRYNVRFGYFIDKKSAIAGLKRYRESQKNDGYLVNFSVESMTNLAKANEAGQPMTIVNPVNKIPADDMPAGTVDVEPEQNNISFSDESSDAMAGDSFLAVAETIMLTGKNRSVVLR